MLWMRRSSGLKITCDLSLFLLPFGRPFLRFPVDFLCLRVCALALQAAFSCSLRTTCSTLTGYERRSRTLISEKAKKANPGIARWNRLEKIRSSPNVSFPALLTTTSSAARMYPSSACQRCC